MACTCEKPKKSDRCCRTCGERLRDDSPYDNWFFCSEACSRVAYERNHPTRETYDE